jgi:hypothetical protein
MSSLLTPHSLPHKISISPKNSPTKSSVTTPIPLLNISTINTQGLNTKGKLESLANSLINESSIILATETKNNATHRLKNRILNHHIIHSIPSTGSKNGACIILGQESYKHLQKITTLNEYWVAVTLAFKGSTIELIAIYLPHDLKERKVAIKSLSSHIKSIKNGILGGDFNSYPPNSKAINAQTSNQKRIIYKHLHNWHDVADIFKKKNAFTHFTKTSASRIDQIWVTPSIASKLLDFKTNTNLSINTDHKEVTLTLEWFNFNKRRLRFTTFLYDLDRTSEAQWCKFRDELDLSCTNTKDWNQFITAIKTSLKSNITQRKQTINTHTKPPVPPHIKELNKTIRKLNKALKATSPNSINNNLKELVEKTSSYPVSKKGIKKTIRVLISEKNHKEHEFIIEKSRESTIQNISAFWKKPKSFIRKALANLKPEIDLNRLKASPDDTFHSNPEETSNIISNHFKNIFRPRNINQNLFQEWEEEYTQKSHPRQGIVQIPLNILNIIISNLPQKKSPADDNITYEILKKFSINSKKILHRLINETLSTGTILKQ